MIKVVTTQRNCTALVVGSDDVASCYSIGVIDKAPGWQKGRKSGGSCSRQLLYWRVPISNLPESAIARLKTKSPDVDPGDQAVGDRQSKHIAKDEREADYEGGRRDHREGV